MLDEEDTIAYDLLDVDRPTQRRPDRSTPVISRTRSEAERESASAFEQVGVDEPRSSTMNFRTERVGRSNDWRSLEIAGAAMASKKLPMKPGKFDGTGS